MLGVERRGRKPPTLCWGSLNTLKKEKKMPRFDQNDEPGDVFSQWMEKREKHYQKFLGKMSEGVMHSINEHEVHVDIYQFEPNKKRPFWTLITGGMSDKRQNVPAEVDWASGRTEVLAYVKEPYDRIFATLKLIAEMPFEEDSFMHWYHTISVGEPVTQRQTELTCVFLMPPIFEKPKFDSLYIGRDKVDFLMMVPITVQERHFAKQNGPEALLEVFEQANLGPVCDENRKSLV
jgi:hypothetical protein